MDILTLVSLALAGGSALLDIVGLAIPYWLNASSVSYHSGLWKDCTQSTCVDFTDVSGRMLAVRAMVILGLLLMVGASVSYFLQRFMMKSNERLTKVAAGLAISGGVFMLMGPIIYATASDIKALLELEGVSLHAGFALCIVAAVAGMAAGISMNLTKPE